MAIAYSDFLDTISSGVRVAVVGVFVRLISNNTGTAYISDAATDSFGKFTYATKPPGDSYTVYTGPSNTGPWTATGDTSYAVPVVAGETPAFNSVTTLVNGPYTPATFGKAGAAYFSGSPWFDVVAYGAKGDGIANDTSAIQAAITAASASGGKVFFPTGTYLINAQLTINASNVSFQGAGRYTTTIKRANSTNQHMFHLTSAVNCEFLDLGLDENGANNATTPHGIWMDQNSSSVLIERCRFINCDGFAVYVFSSNPPVRVNNLRIIDCEFIQNSGGTHDLCTVMSNGGAVIGCRFTVGGTNAGLNIYEAQDIPVTDNVIIGQGTGAKLLNIASVLGCTASANTILGGANDIGIWVICENDNTQNRNCVDTVISNNTLRASGANTTAIFFNAGTNANKSILSTEISGNVIDGWGTGILYFNNGTISGVTVDHNDFTNTTTAVTRSLVPTQEVWDRNRGVNAVAAYTSTLPANPAASSGAAGVMMGLAGSITPVGSGRILIQITGDAFHTIAGDLGFMNARYGTGTAPVNGAANTGTVAGSTINFTSSTASAKVPFVLQAIVSGLTLGTAYWLDVSLGTAAASASIENVVVTAMEL